MPLQAPGKLRTEYLVNPLGLDCLKPRFSWLMVDDRRGARQSAWQVRVTTGMATVWDSGKVETADTSQIEYAGRRLKSRQRYTWQVRVWDAQGFESPWSDPAWFELGVLDQAEWSAAWIRPDETEVAEPCRPAPYLRTEFQVETGVRRARVYVSALGWYELHLNGQRVGEDCFTPGWTDYHVRVTYQAYDVTALLRPGANALGAILANGWYAGYMSWQNRKQAYGQVPHLFAQLVTELENGRTSTVVSDGTWKWRTGPIRAADFYMGETYDARLEAPDWARPGFDDGGWRPVAVAGRPAAKLVATRGPLVRRILELKPVERRRLGDKWLFNLGQNLVGWVRLKVSGRAGQELVLRHAERLSPDGTLYTENLRGARATDHYILRGGGVEVYEPRFTFHGFQYVEVSGLEGAPPPDLITAVVAHSAMDRTGSFECSDPLLNQLQSNILWGQRGNYLEVPTDCPQRDERLGWTGDAQVFVRTAAFNFDVAAFFGKWLVDLTDDQYPDGRFPDVAPDILKNPGGVAAWADAGIICPWTMYLCYGDRRILREHYDAMKKWVDWQDRNSPGGIRADAGYGDWLSINADTPRDLIGTAFFAHTARLLGRIAAIIGRKGDARKYRRLAERVCRAFCREYVTPAGRVYGATQTACVLALHFDLLPADQRQAALDFLVSDIRKRDTRLSCGFVGSPYLNHVLSAHGRADVAYDLLHQTKWPSWLYAVTQGATTIWERWDGWTADKGFQDPGMNSFNHYAYGAIGDWLYRVVAGLELDEDRPGYQHFTVQPQPGGRLTHARAALDSIHGHLESGWERTADGFTFRVTVPPNATATLRLPAADLAAVLDADGLVCQGVTAGRAVFDAGAGTYIIRVKA